MVQSVKIHSYANFQTSDEKVGFAQMYAGITKIVNNWLKHWITVWSEQVKVNGKQVNQIGEYDGRDPLKSMQNLLNKSVALIKCDKRDW